MTASNYPWQPLYMIERSGQPEVVVFGIIAVVTSDGGTVFLDRSEDPCSDASNKPATTSNKTSTKASEQLLMERGDSAYKLWTRSLLKPWQLLSHFRILRESYRDLTPKQFALMSSSHSAEKVHLDLLAQIMSIGKISADKLKCPPTFPMSSEMKDEIKKQGKGPSPIYHNCSGKHCGYLLSLQAQGLSVDNYTSFDNPEHKRVEQVLAEALGVSENTFDRTTDGCQLPNQNLSLKQIAALYRQIAETAARVTPESLELLNGQATNDAIGYIGGLMRLYPELIGGTGRLDTRIMSGEFTGGSTGSSTKSITGSTSDSRASSITSGSNARFIAKGGADGLLAIGVLPNDSYKNGVGIVIKLAAGHDNRHMEVIAAETLSRLGIAVAHPEGPAPAERTDHLKSTLFLEAKDNLKSASA